MTSGAKCHPDFARDAPSRSKYESRLDEIIGAASMLFVTKGYEETSIQDIAGAVGVLKGSLYHYIDAKDDLLFWAMKRNHERLHNFVRAGVETSGVSPMEQLSRWVDRHVDYALSNRDTSFLFVHSFRILSDERRAEILALRRRYEDDFVRLIESAQREQQKADPGSDARLIGRLLLSTFNAVTQWYRPDGKFTMDAIREHCVAITRRSVGSAAEGPEYRSSSA